MTCHCKFEFKKKKMVNEFIFMFFVKKEILLLKLNIFFILESVSGSPPGSYGQLIPSHHNPVIVQDGMHSSVPPVLPPHLLHVILNKDVVDHNDPSLLPEPNHVSLNHLYALSIKVCEYFCRGGLFKAGLR